MWDYAAQETPKFGLKPLLTGPPLSSQPHPGDPPNSPSSFLFLFFSELKAIQQIFAEPFSVPDPGLSPRDPEQKSSSSHTLKKLPSRLGVGQTDRCKKTTTVQRTLVSVGALYERQEDGRRRT